MFKKEQMVGPEIRKKMWIGMSICCCVFILIMLIPILIARAITGGDSAPEQV